MIEPLPTAGLLQTKVALPLEEMPDVGIPISFTIQKRPVDRNSKTPFPHQIHLNTRLGNIFLPAKFTWYS
jgi:hypothetical protein